MKLKKGIIERAQKIWGDDWERIAENFEKKREPQAKLPKKVQKKMGTPEEQFIQLIEQREKQREWELEVVDTIIPKDQLEDGAYYAAMEGTAKLCRHVDKARWDAKKGQFMYERTKFNYTFEDEMDHFADVLDVGYAGFTPIRKLDK